MTTRSRAEPRPTHRPWLAVLLGSLAVAACLPYLALKISWLCGGHLGIPAGSELRDAEGGSVLLVANALTAAMDACVVVLVLALTRDWGRRLPAWLVLAPLWLATGLLAPIVVGFPVVSLVEWFGAEPSGPDPGGADASLDPWVFTLVYTGFGVQALALGGLFARYVGRRWGRLLRPRLDALPGPLHGAGRAAAVGAAVLLLWPAAMRVLWLCGATVGLGAARAGDRDAAFHVTAAADVLFALAAAAGVLLLALRPARFGRVRVWVAVGLAWTGGAALTAWGGWLLAAGVFAGDAFAGGERPGVLLCLVYAGQVMSGSLVLAFGVRLLAGRVASGARSSC
ncbi:hypothetical protein [Streptomyces mayteni]